MKLKTKLKNSIILLDGALGTQLIKRGLSMGEPPETWNLTRPEEIEKVHFEYLQAGSDVILTNTFGVNGLKYGKDTEKLVRAAVKIAKRAAKGFKDRFVALDIGPCGRLLKPLGDLNFEDAVNAFKATVKAGVAAGCDLIFIETMNDVYELKAAVIAAKETCDLPVFASCVFNADMKTLTGTSPEAVVTLLEGLKVDALGLNCSLSPQDMLPVIEKIVSCSSIPVIVKPNAGLPHNKDGKTVYSVDKREFAAGVLAAAKTGARCLGGCCGTSPEYIKEIKKAVQSVAVSPVKNKNLTVVSSYTEAVRFDGVPLIIGERINPTGKKRLKEALKCGDMGYILNEAVTQQERGAHILDVNVGLPEIDEPFLLPEAVCEIQSVCDLPLQIDTSDISAMERAMRLYNGKPMVNSVNGKRESMEAVFPLLKKYGGVAVALTLDENGIPPTAEGRVEIAEKIIKFAKKYGISRNELIFDPLAMAISAVPEAAKEALKAVDIIGRKLKCKTSLGVSNISFGLPNRDFINSTFFAQALGAGLSAAIINPSSQEMIKTYKSHLALCNKDENCLNYINFASATQAVTYSDIKPAVKDIAGDKGLKHAIIKGLKNEAAQCSEALLNFQLPLDVINCEIIPALNEVGTGFENKTVFLPQLLMSAEAASAAFEVIKSKFSGGAQSKKLKCVLATVKGDIHDIGKNIVKTLLENYGFTVCDLGKDVPCESVVNAVKTTGARLCGLSALMTTTVVSMEQTIKLLRENCPDCKIIVGGAVLTAEYAEKLGADAYGKDAMETVRYAQKLENELF